MGNLIEIRNMAKEYDRILFSGLDFNVNEGEILTIFGPSGVGKSTILRILAQLDKPTKGHVTYDSGLMAAAIPLPVVFQESSQLFPWMTVADNMALGGQDPIYLKQLSQDLNLEQALDLMPSQLSGGMKQRVAIGRALMTKSKMLFMDEPFSSLDLIIREKLQDLVLKLQRDYGVTILFITHDLEEAYKLGNRMLILRPNGHEMIDDLKNHTVQEIRNKVSL